MFFAISFRDGGNEAAKAPPPWLPSPRQPQLREDVVAASLAAAAVAAHKSVGRHISHPSGAAGGPPTRVLPAGSMRRQCGVYH